jgi:predicted HD phosphohydrolase
MVESKNHQSKKDFVKNTVEEIFELYDRLGNEVYGEKVTMLMHMLQSALWAEKQDSSNEMVVAAFLHDIGHFFEGEEKMGIFGTMAHDDLGKEFLNRKGFPERLGNLVASHVAAKRYLTAVESSYWNELSDASKETLKFQGGPMNALEVSAFESDPLYKQYVQIRRWDDLGKDAQMIVLPEDLERMKSRVSEYLTNNL